MIKKQVRVGQSDPLHLQPKRAIVLTKSSFVSFVYQYNEKCEETGNVEYIMGRKSM
jgi:hypothetical protein